MTRTGIEGCANTKLAQPGVGTFDFLLKHESRSLLMRKMCVGQDASEYNHRWAALKRATPFCASRYSAREAFYRG